MRVRICVIALCAGALVGVAASSPAASVTLKTKICGQIKHGPYASYVSLLTHRRVKGTTWTVFATGIPCSTATKAAPAVLKWWKTAKPDGFSPTIKGFTCTKESDGHGSAGSAGCLPASRGYPAHANFELIMTGKYTLAQLRKIFGG